MKQPNIVYLHAHDAGRYCQPYGVPVETPNLMRFAKESVLFRKAFAVSPTCGPSRAAMLTGQYPHQNGVFGLPGSAGWKIDDYSKHLVHTLNSAGYMTALAGCQHECDGRDLSPLGYQKILSSGARQMKGWFYPETIELAVEFLAGQAHGSEQPFFLSVGIDEPHRNNIGRPEIGIGADSARFSKTRYYDPDLLDWRYTAPPPFLPDLPEIRQDMASYCEGVRIMDEYMGRILDALQHYDLAENTVVVVTTDHGIEFPGAKKTLSDQGTGVMLMLRCPGNFPKGAVIEPLVSHLDIYPTLLDLTGIGSKSWLEGKSLVPLMRGEAARLHDAVFTEQTYHGRLEALRAVRTERYKLVLRHAATGPILRQDGPSRTVMEAAGYYDRPLGTMELFDLYLDPMEACNRINDPAYQDVFQELHGKIKAWMNETADPFPGGCFPPVPNA